MVERISANCSEICSEAVSGRPWGQQREIQNRASLLVQLSMMEAPYSLTSPSFLCAAAMRLDMYLLCLLGSNVRSKGGRCWRQLYRKVFRENQYSIRDKVFGESYSLENSLRGSIFPEDLFLYNSSQVALLGGDLPPLVRPPLPIRPRHSSHDPGHCDKFLNHFVLPNQ